VQWIKKAWITSIFKSRSCAGILAKKVIRSDPWVFDEDEIRILGEKEGNYDAVTFHYCFKPQMGKSIFAEVEHNEYLNKKYKINNT